MISKNKYWLIVCVLLLLLLISLRVTSAMTTIMRPSSLNIGKQQKHEESKNFIRDAYHAWKGKAGINVVPEERIHETFLELKLYPTREQVHDMLQTAKLYTRRSCSSFDKKSKYWNGLTFGEFCVLASDIRKFRTLGVLGNKNDNSSGDALFKFPSQTSLTIEEAAPCRKPTTNETHNGPEVFLGGSCNPTTWRSDVAIPSLNQLGISFYNPQVSQWTPDLIELEHKAKEKAKVLFFVMDSETRSSAGAIETAHIAGENIKPLVLVLHPYKQNQKILNENISIGEYIDLSRNQILLKQMIRRRGLTVHDNIPSALQQIKGIVKGTSCACRDPPLNVASRLISLRRCYDRVVGNSNYGLTLAQCQQALSSLGYPSIMISSDNLTKVMAQIKEVYHPSTSPTSHSNGYIDSQQTFISFEKFCLIDAYLSILQQEINESSCVSPIKGTDHPPPTVYLTNTPEWVHNRKSTPTTPITPLSPHPFNDTHHPNHLYQLYLNSTSKQQSSTILRSNTTENCKNNSTEGVLTICRTSSYQNRIIGSGSDLSRDSGTSSPQPNDTRFLNNLITNIAADGSSKNSSVPPGIHRRISGEEGEDSDSNDSVFSTGSSLNGEDEEELFLEPKRVEMRDIYLGGSCMLRTRWRQDVAIPFFEEKNVSFHLPTLHESLSNLIESVEEEKLKDAELIYNPAVLDGSRVLLFVITNETRSLAPMTLAAHYIGLGYNVVLCIQMLSEGSDIGGDALTQSAIKDYNRGRAYLIDLAKRQGIPVFKEIKPALACAADKVKMCKSRNSI